MNNDEKKEPSEETNTEPQYVFIPRSEDSSPVLTIAETAIQKLKKFKIARLVWKQENKNISTYVVPLRAKTYDRKNNTFNVKNFFDDTEQVIPASDILQLAVITEEDVSKNKEGSQFFINQANKQKEKYQELIQTYNISPDIFLKEKKDFYSAIYQMPFEELTNIDKCKEFLMNYVRAAIDKEIENVKNEFATANSTGEHQDSQELEHIIEFLTNVKQDYSIFNEAGDYETILKCWPIIIQPSYFSLFQNYIDSYYLINRNNDQ